MAIRNKNVCIKVDKVYFDKIFEPERRKLQNKLGVNFTQSNFTAYMARSGAKIVYPKRNDRFAPKRRKGGFGNSLNF